MTHGGARRPLSTIRTVRDLTRTADALGSYFFSLDTMRVWNSRVSETIRVAESDSQRLTVDGYSLEPERLSVLFITSERVADHSWKNGRRYTLRKAEILPGSGKREGHDILFLDTVSEFGAYSTLREAKRDLKTLPLSEWTNPNTYTERTTS